MKKSVCIDMLLTEYPFEKRIDIAKKLGFDAVEFWKWTNKDIENVALKVKENDINVSIFNIDSFDTDLSYSLSRGILNSGDSDGLLKAFGESVPVCRKLGADSMIVLIGETIDGLSYTEQTENIKKCLKAVAPLAQKENINLLLEPLNRTERKNYFLPFSQPVFDIVKEINCPNIKVLFDIYHQQVTEGGLITKITQNIDLIGHFHVADCPGRHEIGTGEINYANVFKAIKDKNYSRYIGFEFRPTTTSEEALEKINV